MLKPKYLIIPKNRWEDISTLLSLSVSQMQIVAETLRSKETLKTEELSYQHVAKKADISQAEALAVLSAVTNLISQRQRYSLSDEQLLDDLEAGAPGKIKDLDLDTKGALLGLLSESEEGYFVEKAESLKLGFTPHLISVRSICDVRPVFDKNRETIEGALLVTFLGITTHDEEHKDHTFVLQLTRSDLHKLRDCLEEAERKLSVMEKEFGTKFDLFS
jgi:hypothetical protein